MADVFDRIAEWLQGLAFYDSDLEELVEHLCQRLIDGGVPITRVSVSRLMMHPVIGFLDVTWTSDAHSVNRTVLPRRSVSDDLFDDTPFGENAKIGSAAVKSLLHKDSWELADGLIEVPPIRADLTDPSIRDKYPIYGRLAASGVTDYLAFHVPFGKRTVSFKGGSDWSIGASASFATGRRSGFTQRQVDGFIRLKMPLFGTVRILTEQFLVSELMEAYLGRISGQSVLNGQISRGDVREIECALVYSDMHGSTALSQSLSSEDYVAALNRYFDCVAGAVLDHGGEVLKFIGDGILAIFPFDGHRRLPEDMCMAALSAARDAFRRRDELAPGDRVRFGIALHKGAVVYGNVGTENRLDFTATGSSVAKVSRLEDLTRQLDARLLASAAFAGLVPEGAHPLGKYALRGFDEEVDVVSFDTQG